MADYTNNYKYIAETWIDNGEEEGFKTAYLNALLLQWQGHSDDPEHPKFDADTVDGKHFYQIQDAIDEAVRGTIKDFYLGYTHIKSEDGSAEYKIGIDAINLYPDIANIDDGALETYSAYKDTILIPWGIVEAQGEVGYLPENPTLYEFLKEMYNILKDDIDDKADSSRVKTLEDWKTATQETLGNLDVLPEGGINAKAVNGIRFFIVTQAQYEGLDADVRTDLHNVFIIKDQEDITAYYDSIGKPSNVYIENPDILPFDQGYEFKIDMAEYDGETVRCLMYKIATDSNWKVIAPTSHFIDSEALNNLLNQNGVNFYLSKEAIINSLDTLDAVEDKSKLDALHITEYYDNRYDGKYISKATENVYTYNNQTDSISVSTQNSTITTTSNPASKILDLQTPINSLYNALLGKIGKLNTRLTTIEAIKDPFNDLLNNYNNLTRGKTKTIKQIEDIIGPNQNQTGLFDRIEALEGKDYLLQTNIDTWEEDYIGGLIYPRTFVDSSKTLNDWTTSLKKRKKGEYSMAPINMVDTFYVSQSWYNRALGLCVVYLRFLHWHEATDVMLSGVNMNSKKKWVPPRTLYFTSGGNNKPINWSEYNSSCLNKQSSSNDPNTAPYLLNVCTVAHPPITTITVPSLVHPANNFICINTSGEIFVYSNETKSRYRQFRAQVTYKVKGDHDAIFDIVDNEDEE